MKNTKKIITLLFLSLLFQISFAQYKALQINLEINSLKKEVGHIRFSLYQQDSIVSLLGIKHNPYIDMSNPETWMKRDADTIIKVSTKDFNRIARMCVNLPYTSIIKGADLSEPKIVHDGVGVTLELMVNQNVISFNICCPMNNTKERKLEQFVEICKEILTLAGYNYKTILR